MYSSLMYWGYRLDCCKDLIDESSTTLFNYMQICGVSKSIAVLFLIFNPNINTFILGKTIFCQWLFPLSLTYCFPLVDIWKKVAVPIEEFCNSYRYWDSQISIKIYTKISFSTLAIILNTSPNNIDIEKWLSKEIPMKKTFWIVKQDSRISVYITINKSK